jgi:hypothetical protein
MKLADRPAYWLDLLMSERGYSSPPSLGREVWPDAAPAAQRAGVRNVLTGHWPKPETLEQIAAHLEVDAGAFYAEPSS